MTASYIKHGFLAALYEPWTQMEGSEWGDAMSALRQAYGATEMWSEDELDTFEKILRVNIDAAHEDLAEDYPDEVLSARDAYDEIVDTWTYLADSGSFPGGRVGLEAALASVPEWMRSPDDGERKARKLERLHDAKANHEACLAEIERKIKDL